MEQVSIKITMKYTASHPITMGIILKSESGPNLLFKKNPLQNKKA